MSLFLELIQVSLGTREQLSRIPCGGEWEFIIVEAQRQAVLGIIIEGLECLPQEQLPPKELLLHLIGLSQINENSYRLHVKRAAELTERFKKGGIKSCVLKGLGFAQLYPIPSRRQCGDIDLWVEGECKDVLLYLRSEYEIEHILWHHVEAKIIDDVETEIHYHPCWLYNPFYNKRLQKWFENQKADQMVVAVDLGFAYPTVRFNAVYALVHFYHHMLEEGIGIRHVVDYHYILKSLPPEEKALVVADLERFFMMRLAKAMMWVLQELCGTPKDYLLCECDEKEGLFLLDEIKRGGNFGH